MSGELSAPIDIVTNRLKLTIDPARGGALGGLWFDPDGKGQFPDSALILDTGPNQGLVMEAVELPGRTRTLPASEWVAGRRPHPMESWHQGESYRLSLLTDSVELESPTRAVVLGHFMWAGYWPYRLAWEVTDSGAVIGEFQLLPGSRESRPSEVLALGMDMRFHYHSRESFLRRAVHAGVDDRIWELPAEVIKWWKGIEGYISRPEHYGFTRHEEVPWPIFNLVTLVQNAAADCRLWKTVAPDTGNLTHWRGARSRGWMHVEDRSWGMGFGLSDMPATAPTSLSADLDLGDLAAALKIGFWPRQAHRLDPRADADALTRVHRFFLRPNPGRWDDGAAAALDQLGLPANGIRPVEPDAAKVMFTKPRDLPPSSERGGGAVFRVDEPSVLTRKAWPISVGVPLRQGEVMLVGELGLVGSDQAPIPCQLETLAYWPDGSVKWALIDAQADLMGGAGATLALRKGAFAPPPATRVVASEIPTGVRVVTGPLAFEIDRNGSGFIDRAWLDLNGDGRFDDSEMVIGDGGEGRRSMLDFVRSDVYATGDHDIRGTRDESQVRIEELKIERNGPLRVVVLIRGKYCNRVASPFTLRLEAYAGKPWVRAQHTFTYTMDPQGEFIKATGLSLPLNMSGGQRSTLAGSDGPVLLDPGIAQAGLLQESLNKSTIWGCERSSGLAKTLQSGTRSSGWANVSNGKWGLTVAVQNFWQEFAKGVTVDVDRAEVTAWFWPPEAPPLDLRRYSRWMHPQVGESTSPWPAQSELRNVGYATGLTKTSTAVFAFHVGPAAPDECEALAAGFQDRPIAICNPSYYGEVGIAGSFAPYDDASYPILERSLTDICDWFMFNRARFSWYGLIDYGDIGHTWAPPIRYDDDGPFLPRDGWAYDIGRWGWTNTEGQDALGYLMSFFHTGFRPYFDAGAITACHNRDIDIFHWGPMKYWGHTRHNVNHWGDGDFEIRISQPTPTRFHYYLTGDLRSRDIIEGVVDERYLYNVITQSADFGAVLYGFLQRWEMTGDPAWRERALGLCYAYRDCLLPDGCFPHRGYAIEPSTGRHLKPPDPAGNAHDLMFSHGFGTIHAMVELHELTGDEKLWDMLYRHAEFCVTAEPQVSAYTLLLAYALDRTGERRFADRLLANLARRRLNKGAYPRDRALWAAPQAGAGQEPSIRTVQTSGTGFEWSPLPVVLKALAARGVKESELPG